MKTIDKIIKSRPVFLNDWKESKEFGVIVDFEGVYITLDEYKKKDSPYSNVEYWNERKKEAEKALAKHKDEKILFATYFRESYEGSSWVLFEKDGKLFEISASHCSCYGLEQQWNPEEVSLKELENRIKNGSFGESYYSGSYKNELAKFLGIFLNKKTK